MKRFARGLTTLAIVAMLAAPLGAAASCTTLNGTFIGSHGVATITANATTATFSGTFHSKIWGDGTFAGITTDGKTYASGSIVLSKVGRQTFRIVPLAPGAIDITIGTTTYEAKCGS